MTEGQNLSVPAPFSRGVWGSLFHIVVPADGPKKVFRGQMPSRTIPQVSGACLHTLREDCTGMFDTRPGIWCCMPTENPPFPRLSSGTSPPRFSTGPTPQGGDTLTARLVPNTPRRIRVSFSRIVLCIISGIAVTGGGHRRQPGQQS